jgi:hypothetical protein
MSIDRTTYELYIMDYLDGRLDAVAVSELLLFLEQNPDLKEEFEGMRNFKLERSTDVSSLDKSVLKKPSYDGVKHLYEPMLIARMEGDETIQEASQLDKAAQLYPELKKDEQLFLQTRLEPDLLVVYKNKSRLRVFTLTTYYKPVLRVAAILLCISAVGLFIYRNNNLPTTSQTANNANKQATSVPAQSVKPGNSMATLTRKKDMPEVSVLPAAGTGRNNTPNESHTYLPVAKKKQPWLNRRYIMHWPLSHV